MVTDNEALGRADFTPYSATIPSDPRLPDGGGGTLTGLFDPAINPAARNVVKNADAFGKQQQQWQGVDVSLDARLQSGLYLQGGVNIGKTMTDNGDIVDDVPESLASAVPIPCSRSTSATPRRRTNDRLWKGLAAYTLPWYGIGSAGLCKACLRDREPDGLTAPSL